MKKYTTLLMAIVMILTLAVSVSAATTMFDEAPEAYLTLPIEDCEFIDDDTTQDLGGNGTFISIVDGYGCGNSSQNDCVVFRDVDFGANGAKAINLLFGFGLDDGSVTTLSVAVDSEDNVVGNFEIGFTGGWEIANASWVQTEAAIPAGVHTVYIRFTNEKSGSFSQVSFVEGDPLLIAPPPVEPPVDNTGVASENSDAGIVCSVFFASAAAVVALTYRKNRR